VLDFVGPAWDKVMNPDRYDMEPEPGVRTVAGRGPNGIPGTALCGSDLCVDHTGVEYCWIIGFW